MVKKYCFKNVSFSKRELKNLVSHYYFNYGISKTNCLLDSLKDLGFYFATKASISLAIEDLKVPPIKKLLIIKTNNEITVKYLKKLKGHISEIERLQKVIDLWNQINTDLKKEVVKHFKSYDSLNPIYMMAFSGARGNLSQVHQLIGMRGLMSDPSGQILDIPIQANFREGLKITDYIISSYGARKGIVDTALKTADSGYLTRRLVDVAQHVIIREIDCNTNMTILIKDSVINSSHLIGRLIVKRTGTNFNSLIKNEKEITHSFINLTKDALHKDILIKSPLTCISSRSVCQKCYGWNLAQMNMVEIGEAVGIIAAQSIGEPGTQLTMRTFHTGGVISNDSMIQIRSKYNGQVIFSSDLKTSFNRTIYGEEAMEVDNSSTIFIIQRSRSIIKFLVFERLLLSIHHKQNIKVGTLIAEIPITNNQSIKTTTYIRSDLSGEIRYQNIRIAILYNSYTKIIKDGILWVLGGNLMIFPENALLNIKENSYFINNNNIFSLKIRNKQNGIIKIRQFDSLKKELMLLNCQVICEFSSIFKAFVKYYTVFYLFTRTGILFQLMLSNSKFEILNNRIAYRITSKYDITTSGKLYRVRIKSFNIKKDHNESLLFTQKKLIIPIENYFILKDVNKVSRTLNKYIPQYTKLASNCYSINCGLFIINKLTEVGYHVLIISGKINTVIDINEDLIKCFSVYDLYYRGEIVFSTLKIKKLMKINITNILIKSKKRYKFELFCQPIIQCAIPRNKNYTSQFINENNSQILINSKLINCYESNNLIIKSPKQHKLSLIQYLLESNFSINDPFASCIYFIQNTFNSSFIYLAFFSYENTKFITGVNNLNQLSKIQINLLVKHNQFVESYSNIMTFSAISTKIFFTNKIKSHAVIKNCLLYTTTNSYISNKLFKESDKLNNLGYCSNKFITADKTEDIKRKILKIRVGQPYFISKGTTMYINHGDFIQKSKVICLLIYEKIISGDIIQGLPKIEYILESRISKSTVKLAKKPGIVMCYKNKNSIIIINRMKRSNYLLQNFNKKLCGGNIVSVGQALETGIINPHHVLRIYFKYYGSLSNLYEASFRSVIAIQILLINSIQRVYKSQGVTISDKHIELIIKQMSSKVQIMSSASNSKILPGEVIDVQQIQYVNRALRSEKQSVIQYRPILFGITRTSLLTESFISAASFEQTAKVLITAASEGRTDWLRGLKENIIIGNLIPAGTGFDMFGTLETLELLEPK
jgi:DNA-directed RNA polymerase subunit beta'